MTLEGYRWAAGSREPSKIIYKIVCMAMHFVEGEKSAQHPKQIKNTGLIQLSHVTYEETEAHTVAQTPPGHVAPQRGSQSEDPGQPLFLFWADWNLFFTYKSLGSASSS